MKYFHIVFFLLICFYSFSQSDFRKGKIITLKGDTIHGELDYQGDIKNSQGIRFKYQKGTINYKPFDIKAYIFDDGKYYVSKKLVNNKETTLIFVEYLVKGEKDLFFFRDPSGFHYAIGISDDVIKKIPYKKKIVEIDGVRYEKHTTVHMGMLKEFFKELPSLFPKIESMEVPNRSQLISLTKEYHDQVCGEGSCIVFEKSKNRFRMAVEPVYSFGTKSFDLLGENNGNALGVHVYFWLPNANENLYFKTGFLSTEINDLDIFSNPISYNLYQVPLQFQYIFPTKIVQPTFHFGSNFFFDSKDYGIAMSLAAGGGFMIKISETLHINLDLNTDLIGIRARTDLFFTFNARAGLFIKI